jgi:hypothetical protein
MILTRRAVINRIPPAQAVIAPAVVQRTTNEVPDLPVGTIISPTKPDTSPRPAHIVGVSDDPKSPPAQGQESNHDF